MKIKMSSFTQNGKTPGEIFDELIGTVRFGHLVIPESITELPDRLFDSYKFSGHNAVRITSVEIPGTVRRIGSRAFGDCVYSKQVTIAEGAE